MIRINLLPVRQARKREYGKQQLLIGLIILVVQLAVLFVIYSRQNEELSRQEAEVRAAQESVDALETRNRELIQLMEQRENLLRISGVLEELEANRAGPVQVMDEFKRILNVPVDDLERIAQREQGWDTNWDPTNLWVSQFTETNGRLELRGMAASNDDIAEFHTRLLQSPYFDRIVLRGVRAESHGVLGRAFSFEIDARVNYGLAGSGSRG